MSVPPLRRPVRRRAPTAEERRRILAEESRSQAAAAGAPAEVAPAVVTGVLGLLGLVIVLAARRVEPIESFPVQLGVAGGLVGGTLYALGIFRFLARQGPPRTGLAFVLRGVIVVLAVAGAALAATGGLTLLNAGLDRREAGLHKALITDKTRQPSGNGTVTAVRVEWTGDVVRDFTLPENVFEQIEPLRTYLVVRTREGAFGWPWIEGTSGIERIPEPAEETAPAAAQPSVEEPRPVGAAALSDADRLEARALVARGREALKTGGAVQAMDDFKRAIELDPWFTTAYSELDKVLRAQRQVDASAEYWSKLIETSPTNRDGWFGRAQARATMNDTTGALADADEACKLGHTAACQMAERLRGPGGR
jgi:hypothetical protein